METENVPRKRRRKDEPLLPGWAGWLLSFVLVLLIVAWLSRPEPQEQSAGNEPKMAVVFTPDPGRGQIIRNGQLYLDTNSTPRRSAEEILATKLSQFSESRRGYAREMARRRGETVPDEVEKFFDAVASGDWEEIKRRFDPMAKRSGQYEGSTADPSLNACWPAVLDAFGAAEQVHEWPAQALLDYGNAILDSLKPGMVYVGGTDSGRWIPSLLNDTSAGEQHIVITQNALADSRYLEYVELQYGERFNALNQEDSAKAFQDYVQDAKKRFEHDRDFPNEPKQVKHAEMIEMVDNKVQVSGRVAVTAINEQLLTTLMEKNPELSFGLQESIPLTGTYAGALPNGALMELGAKSEERPFTAELANESTQYWREKAEQTLAADHGEKSDYVRKTYSHEAVSSANLLAANGFTQQAEEGYRLAMKLWPGSSESAGTLADFLSRNGRRDDAVTLLQEFSARFPGEQKGLEQSSSLWREIKPTQ